MIDKKQVIDELIKLINNDDLIINEISIDNDSIELASRSGSIQYALTGYKKIEIQMINKKIHSEFAKKLKP